MQPLLAHLDQDHGNVSRILDVLDRQCGALQRGDEINPQLLRRIFQYMTRYQDVFHHPREDFLFERLVSLSPTSASEVAVLEQEHRTLSVAGLALYERVAGDLPDTAADDTAKQLNDYVDMLRRHMATESRHVFPMAQAVLSGADWKYIDEQLEARPDPLFRDSVEKGYRVVIEALAKG